MKNFRAYYETFGCQMNVFDIEVIESFMVGEGFSAVSSPEQADVIVINTCSVREHAELRALDRLANLSRNTDAILVVCGCMAQRLGDGLFDMVPRLDIIAGTDNYRLLPKAIVDVMQTGGRISLLDVDHNVSYPLGERSGHHSVSRYLAITRGCENYCTYCIVPYLRGKVRSRSISSIINEIHWLCQSNCKEVTLVGQNVMSYRDDEYDFPALLERIAGETGIARIRFLTTHPRDVTPRVFELMAAEPRISPHIHLPLQSGSDRILDLMNRGYRRNTYIHTIETARGIVPDLAVTTDVIVGFPGETEDDFRMTLETVDEIRFDAAFTFKYSPREGTPAALLPDDVPMDVKRERLRILNEKIRKIRRNILEGHIDSTAEILLDGVVQKGEYHLWKGRTPHFRNVLVYGNYLKDGDFVTVTLKELQNFTYIAETPARR